MVVAASPSPPAPHAAAADRPHPTYTKMITRALKDMGGSSARPAISDYILGSFSGLPDSHEALLSAHLRRLLAEGVLHTEESAYTYGPPPQPAGEKRGPRNDSSDASPAPPAAAPVAVAVVGEKRGRGRPRKIPLQATPSVLPAKRKQPGSVLLSGDDDDSVANTPMRAAAEAQEATPVQNGGMKRGRGRPLGSKAKKRPRGRPRKEAASKAAGSVGASRGFKRGCGRPNMGRPVETRGMEESSSAAVKRGRGRPRKHPAAAMSTSETRDDDAAGVKKEPGMMEEPAAAAMSAETGDGGMEADGGGTPRRAAAAISTGVKRGVGRPRKHPASAAATSEPARMAAAAASGDAMSTPVGVKRGRGRPPKNNKEAMSAAETGDAVVKREGFVITAG